MFRETGGFCNHRSAVDTGHACSRKWRSWPQEFVTCCSCRVFSQPLRRSPALPGPTPHVGGDRCHVSHRSSSCLVQLVCPNGQTTTHRRTRATPATRFVAHTHTH
eukprot:8697332-Karenia_brevis.AAC.1